MQRLINSKRVPFALYWRMFNYWPAIRGTGVRVTYVSRDWGEIRVKLKLSFRTRNYVGTIFGGSIYGATDPFLMVMALRQIGPDYVVWDKSASIVFKRPADRTLYASFKLPPSEIKSLQDAADAEGSVERNYTIDLVDSDGKVYATVEKMLYVANKQWFKHRHDPKPVDATSPA